MTNRALVFDGRDIYGNERGAAWQPKAIDLTKAADFTVPCGTSVQAAIDAAITLGKPSVIHIQAGFFEGPIVIPQQAPPLTLCGAGAGKTIITAPIDAQMTGLEFRTGFGTQIATYGAISQAYFAKTIGRQTIGTRNTAVLSVSRDDVNITGMTIRNDYQCDRIASAPHGAEPDAEGRFANGQHQAVALMIDGPDRVQIRDCALSSFQDTFYLRANPLKPSRVAIDRCAIIGDVDFIFGGATAHFADCTIRSSGLRGTQSWVAAPSTSLHLPFGFVFGNCAFTHDGAEAGRNGGCFLGRQWFEGVRSTPYGTDCAISDRNGQGMISRTILESVGKCAILNATLGEHLNPDHLWDNWGGRNGSPRFRPVQHRPSDFLRLLGPWLETQSLDYAKIKDGPDWLIHR